VPIAVDQDPHVRICRDLAGKERYDVEKPATLLGRFLPGLSGPGKMSSSNIQKAIRLTDDPETVEEKIMKHAYSGGRESVESHREHGGDPESDVAYQLLFAFFEPDDETVERLAYKYRSGELLSGELKTITTERINEFLADHHSRRPEGDLKRALAPYRLTEEERERLASDFRFLAQWPNA
jgi:tryptophanyl-tRNA synthetase